MPHLIIEHSSNIKSQSIKLLQVEIQNIMASITEGNFDPDQCKARSHSFDEFLVGKADQSNSSFLHIAIKILSGRSAEIRKKLSTKSVESAEKFFLALNLPSKRCDISVDIVEMDRSAYSKIRIGNQSLS